MKLMVLSLSMVVTLLLSSLATIFNAHIPTYAQMNILPGIDKSTNCDFGWFDVDVG